MGVDLKYLIRKFIALGRHHDFNNMLSVYTEDDLFASYLALTALNRKLQGKLQHMRLTSDDHTAFHRVLEIIGGCYRTKYASTPIDKEKLASPLIDPKPSLNSSGKPQNNSKNPGTSSITADMLKKKYLDQNMSIQDIATEFGYTRPGIYKIMRKYGIKRRTRSEARSNAVKKGKFVDTF